MSGSVQLTTFWDECARLPRACCAHASLFAGGRADAANGRGRRIKVADGQVRVNATGPETPASIAPTLTVRACGKWTATIPHVRGSCGGGGRGIQWVGLCTIPFSRSSSETHPGPSVPSQMLLLHQPRSTQPFSVIRITVPSIGAVSIVLHGAEASSVLVMCGAPLWWRRGLSGQRLAAMGRGSLGAFGARQHKTPAPPAASRFLR